MLQNLLGSGIVATLVYVSSEEITTSFDLWENWIAFLTISTSTLPSNILTSMPHSLNHLLMNLLSSSLLPQFLMNFVLVHDTFVDDFMTIAGGTVLLPQRHDVHVLLKRYFDTRQVQHKVSKLTTRFLFFVFFIRKIFVRKWATKILKKMLIKSPSSNAWAAIFKNAGF